MTTIQENVEISEDRRLCINVVLPESLPVGMAKVRLTVIPGVESFRQSRLFDGLFGSLKFGGAEDGIAIQRKMRDEW